MVRSINLNISNPIKSLLANLPGSFDLEKEFQKLFVFFSKFGYEARFVGGCVRDIILNTTIYDIDMATNMPTQFMLEQGKADGFNIIPTGINHGTVTFILDKLEVQITTLRKDIKTDGRHAVIEFTNSWKEDSYRRDFSFNALYLDEKGKIYDFHNGISDLKNGTIRFIGNPNNRIKEDYLRIFRYFRFWGKYAAEQIDTKTLEQINQNLDGILTLSGERIRDELFKIFKLKNAKLIIDLMMYILKKIFNLDKNLLNYKYNFSYDINFIVLCCGFVNEKDLLFFLDRLKINSELKNRSKNVFKFINNGQQIADFLNFPKKERNIVLNAIKAINMQKYKELNKINDEIIEEFEIHGRDILSKFPNFPKKKISLEISNIKKYWIASRGKITNIDCIKLLHQNICKNYNDCL